MDILSIIKGTWKKPWNWWWQVIKRWLKTYINKDLIPIIEGLQEIYRNLEAKKELTIMSKDGDRAEICW